MKAALSLITFVVLAFTNSPIPIRAQAKPKAPPYLNQFPSVERVKAEIRGGDPIDTAARQQQAFWLLNQMIPDLAGQRFDNDEMSGPEEELRSKYGDAFQSYQYKERLPSPQDQPRWKKLLEFYETDPGFLDELLKHFFTPEFRAGYYRTTKKQPPSSTQNARTESSTTNTNPGFATEPTAVLLVSNGFQDPRALKALTGMPLYLLNDSFARLLQKKKLLDGPPGATVKVTPLRTWATSCLTGSPVCQGMLYEVQSNIVGAAKMEATGKTTFAAVPPGSYYLLGLTADNQQPIVWDLRVDLKAGENSIAIGQQNVAQLDIRAPQTASTPTRPPAGTNGLQSSSARPTGPKNSTLTIAATNGPSNPVGGRYLYLLDEDAEQILKSAGFQQQMFLGKPLPLLNSLEFVSRMVTLQETNVGFKILDGLGGSLIPPEVKQQYELGVEALSQHVVGYVKTNAAGRATFAAVPAGTYYVYGTTSEYVKVGEVVTIDRRTPTPTVTKNRDVGYDTATIWNLKVSIKPGPNSTTLSQGNAVFVTGRN